MNRVRSFLACFAGTAALVICNSLTALAQVATIVCTGEAIYAVTLGPSDEFVLTCQSPFNQAAPENFHTQACQGTGANCTQPVTYGTLFPSAKDHKWVEPQSASNGPHTWTAPSKDKLGTNNTVFSVGCRQANTAGGTAKICAVNVTASSAIKRVVSGIVLAVCSIASLAVL